MATLQRQRVTWTGFPGGPGISTFYFNDAASCQAALHTFLVAFRDRIPTDCLLTIEPGGDIIDSATGLITGGWLGAATAGVQGDYSGTHSAVSGFMVKWSTDLIVGGKRIRGRTFFVPAGVDIYDNDGAVNAGTQAMVNAAAAALVAALPSPMFIWQRPRVASPSWTDVHGRTHPAKAARAGNAGQVLGGSCPPKTVALRSRRD